MRPQLNIQNVKDSPPENFSVFADIAGIGSIEDAYSANDMAVLTLYDNGIIRACNIASAELLGCASKNIIWLHISQFLPQLGEVSLINGGAVSPYLKFLSRIGHRFEVIDLNGVHFFSKVFFNDVEDFGCHCLRIIFRPITYPAF